jgi:hypothetical protein
MASKEDAAIVLKAFARDLCTRTEEEVAGIWAVEGACRAGLEKVRPGYFDKVIQRHNPIYFIARHIWFDNDTSLLYEPFHRDRVAHHFLHYYFSDDIGACDGVMLLAQRDSFKTAFAHGAVPHFCSFRGRHVHNRDERILLLHHKIDLATENLKILRSKSMDSEFLRWAWPEFAAEEEWGTEKGFNWPCKAASIQRENSINASGLTSKQTGRHYDFILADDIVDEEHRFSKRIRDECRYRFSATRSLLDTKRGKIFITGTFYHQNDLYSMLEKSGDYRVEIIPAGGSHSQTKAPLSFPSRHSQEFLDKKLREFQATGDSVFYYLQYQLERKSDKTLATDEMWVKRIPLERVPNGENCFTVITIDPAIKGGKNQGQGDNHAIAVVRIERRGVQVNRYLLDLVHSNELTQAGSDSELFRLMQKWGTGNVCPEEHGSHVYRTHLRDEAGKRGLFINIIDLKSRQVSKENRILVLIGQAEAGNFYITDECENAEVFIEQFIDYGPSLDHDDAIDAVAYSCDEAIMVGYVPAATGDDNNYWQYPFVPPPPRRTRHTTV